MTFNYGSRTVSMLDLHLALCAFIWGLFVLLPPNNLFHYYITLKPLGSWGLNELTTGIVAMLGGVMHVWSIFRSGYQGRRYFLIAGTGWWTLVSLATLHSRPILPAAGIYIVMAIMCGAQSIRAKHHSARDQGVA